MKSTDRFALIVDILSAESKEMICTGGDKFGEMIPKRARLICATPGSRNRVPGLRNGFARLAHPGVAIDNRSSGKLAEIHRDTLRRTECDVRQFCPWQVCAGAVIFRSGKVWRQFRGCRHMKNIKDGSRPCKPTHMRHLGLAQRYAKARKGVRKSVETRLPVHWEQLFTQPETKGLSLDLLIDLGDEHLNDGIRRIAGQTLNPYLCVPSRTFA